MRKFLKWFLILLVVAGLLAYGALLSVDSLAKKAIEEVGTRMLGVPLTLDKVKIELSEGSINFSNLNIATPEGFTAPKTLSFKSIDIKAAPNSILEDTVIVNHIHINSPEIHYELNQGGDNIRAIVANLKKASAGSDKKVESKDTPRSKTKVVIDEVILKDIKVFPIIGGQKMAPITLTDIRMQDIGKDNGGVMYKELAIRVLRTIQNKVANVGLGSLNVDKAKEVMDGVKNKTNETLDGLMKAPSSLLNNK